MLLFMVFLTLTLQTCLGKMDTLHPSKPCTNMKKKDGYNSFCRHHLRKDTPDDLDKKKWQEFITKIGTWNRTTQSFFPFNESKSVLAVCSSGGKIYKENLCISKKPLFFFTAEINSKKKKVKNVKLQEQHVILACSKIEKKCRPVHFEKNSKDFTPDNKQQDCSKPKFTAN